MSLFLQIRKSPNESPQELWIKFLGGDKNAFGNLYHKTSENVFWILHSMLRNNCQAPKSEAEDLVQEVFIKVFKMPDEYPEECAKIYAIGGYLRQTARFEGLNFIKKHNGRSTIIRELASFTGSYSYQNEDRFELEALLCYMKKVLNEDEYLAILYKAMGYADKETAQILYKEHSKIRKYRDKGRKKINVWRQ